MKSKKTRRLKNRLELVEAVIEASSDIIIITGPKGNILNWNSGAKNILGYSEKEMKGKSVLDLIVDEQGRTNGKEFKEMLKKKKKVENYRCFYRRKDGGREPVLLTVNLVYDKNGRIRRVVGIAKNIRREMELEATLRRKNQELELLSLTDPLTGIYNKRFFETKINEEVTRAFRFSHPLSLLFVDFDELKKVNDRHGHLTGDNVLTGLARVITGLVKETDIVARFGGDEFCVIAPEANKENALDMAERIRDKIEKLVFESGKMSFSVTVSIGVAGFSPTVINTAEKLVDSADGAARLAKGSGKNKVLHADDLEKNVIQV